MNRKNHITIATPPGPPHLKRKYLAEINFGDLDSARLMDKIDLLSAIREIDPKLADVIDKAPLKTLMEVAPAFVAFNASAVARYRKPELRGIDGGKS